MTVWENPTACGGDEDLLMTKLELVEAKEVQEQLFDGTHNHLIDNKLHQRLNAADEVEQFDICEGYYVFAALQ